MGGQECSVWAGALATVAWYPMLSITNCAIWIIAAFTVAWIVSLRLTEDEEDVSIKPRSLVLAASLSSSNDLGFRIDLATNRWFQIVDGSADQMLLTQIQIGICQLEQVNEIVN